MAPVVVERESTAKKRSRSAPGGSNDRQKEPPKYVSKRAQKCNEQKESRIKMYHMNPFPRSMFLRRFSVPELMRVAVSFLRLSIYFLFQHIATPYFKWVRGYMAEMRVLNIKACNNKMCLSRGPCKYSNYSCTHRVIRSVSCKFLLGEFFVGTQKISG
jgi:hypothetical protein